jgi:hypothetical protein
VDCLAAGEQGVEAVDVEEEVEADFAGAGGVPWEHWSAVEETEGQHLQGQCPRRRRCPSGWGHPVPVSKESPWLLVPVVSVFEKQHSDMYSGKRTR